MTALKIDAAQHHSPEKAAEMIIQASLKAGGRHLLAERLGMHRESLRLIHNGTHRMSYPLQIALEAIIEE